MKFYRRIALGLFGVIFVTLQACNQEKSSLSCNSKSNYSDASVYKPCKEFVFNAIYWRQDELISEEKISIFITGNSWNYDSSQVEVLHIYEFDFDDSSIEKIRLYGINKEINNRDWVKQSSSGIIDDKSIVFLHPFRDNQYYFTEIAPFPQINHPLHVGKSWSAALNIGGGWGEWDGQRLETSYQVVSSEPITINDYVFENCWKISSSATSDFGVSHLTMWYNEEFGFVKLIYVTYADQVLQLELQEVVNH